jgi:IMP dehydrogenase
VVFIEKLKKAELALSVDDVYLAPGLAEVDPQAVDLSTRFSTRVKLLIPLASSPMDTVTEFEMAVAMALLGGIGVVHRNMEIEKQVEIVKKVKEHPPIRTRVLYVEPDTPCGRVLEVMRDAGVRSMPVVSGGRVKGYVHYSEVKAVCRSGLEHPEPKPGEVFSIARLGEAKKLLLEGRLDAVALANFDGVYISTLVYRDVMEETLPAVDESGRLVIAAAISPFDRARALALDRYADALVADVAHFHNAEVLRVSRHLVKELSSDFIVGNIASKRAVEDIASQLDKVDGFRVGLGGGSICTTPEVAGVYIPTLYAVAEVRDAAESLNLKTPVIGDGGIRTPGDIVKVLAAGASVAMVGHMLAGTDEASAPLIAIGNKLYKPYRGMASEGAMVKRFAIDRYARISKKVAEGVEGLVEYKGSIYTFMSKIIEAVKAGFGYVGARNIDELWRKALFIAAKRGGVGVITQT